MMVMRKRVELCREMHLLPWSWEERWTNVVLICASTLGLSTVLYWRRQGCLIWLFEEDCIQSFNYYYYYYYFRGRQDRGSRHPSYPSNWVSRMICVLSPPPPPGFWFSETRVCAVKMFVRFTRSQHAEAITAWLNLPNYRMSIKFYYKGISSLTRNTKLPAVLVVIDHLLDINTTSFLLHRWTI